MSRRTVVTGAAGLIGKRLVRRLIDKGNRVVAVDRVEFSAQCEIVVADITEARALAPLLDESTTIYHMAGLTSVAGSVSDPHADFDVNMRGFINILESARERTASVIFPSSASVFDPQSPLPHAETAPKSPSSPYAAAKLAGEAYCAAYRKCYGLDIKIARLFNVYGPGMTRFAIFDFYRKIRSAQNDLEILGDGKQCRDYLYVDDAADGLIQIAEQGAPGEDYNLATGRPTILLELAETMSGLMGKPHLKIRPSGRSFAGDVAGWYADISKLKTLGFEPVTSLREGLLRTIAWLDQEWGHFKQSEQTATTH